MVLEHYFNLQKTFYIGPANGALRVGLTPHDVGAVFAEAHVFARNADGVLGLIVADDTLLPQTLLFNPSILIPFDIYFLEL